MHYYEIGVNHRGLKGLHSLTYSSGKQRDIGDIVQVGIRGKVCNGVVLEEVKKPTYQTKQINAVIHARAIPAHLIQVAAQMAEYYAVDMGTVMGLVLPRGVEKNRRSRKQTDHQIPPKQQTPKLTSEQSAAISHISQNRDTYLLKGVTGSGKTQVYIELAKLARAVNQGAIVLVPEIGLTSQMVSQFVGQLRTEVFVIHSNQTEAERHKLWELIRQAKAPTVIGPRSALFSPIASLGLIVVDEEHETSYKQDLSPKYHAVRVASMLREHAKATLVLGSATPSLEDFHLANQRPDRIVSLTKPVKELAKTEVSIVDMRLRSNFKQSKWLSDQLINAIRHTLEQNKQVLLFQNRRGNATSVICEHCGWVDECPHCLIPLTHHRDWSMNVCHTCNYRHQQMPFCPSCKQPELVYKGAGTKELYAIVEQMFPTATTERFDSDVLDRSDKLEQRYQAIIDGEVDIVVGTQMIAKGLDIPSLGLVGIANADTALYLPDFSSAERTFQLISQVVGRVGRHSAGSVIIQTYSPTSPSITLAAAQDWESFYQRELNERKTADYPPFIFLLKLTIEKKQESSAKASATKLASMLRKQIKQVTVLGPSPAFHYKTRTGWRWQIVIKAHSRTKLVHIARNLPSHWQFELDPINLL